MGHGVYTTDKNMANGIYFKMLTDLTSKLQDDYLSSTKINTQQYERVREVIFKIWPLLCEIDEENGIGVD